MSTGSTCSTAGATSKRSRRATKPSSARRRSTTARSVKSRREAWGSQEHRPSRAFATSRSRDGHGHGGGLGVAHPVGGVGEGREPAAGPEVEHSFQLAAAIEPCPLDALPVTLKDTPADVRIERRRLDAKEVACLGRAQVCLAVDLDHVSQAYVN